eukprot:m.601258 g.601258  ORF g.601258 m.601258 type:complete len:83 (+) comp22440_c0_seq11:2458-2706(+)
MILQWPLLSVRERFECGCVLQGVCDQCNVAGVDTGARKADVSHSWSGSDGGSDICYLNPQLAYSIHSTYMYGTKAVVVHIGS